MGACIRHALVGEWYRLPSPYRPRFGYKPAHALLMTDAVSLWAPAPLLQTVWSFVHTLVPWLAIAPQVVQIKRLGMLPAFGRM